MPHAALADLYRRTRVVVVPSQLQGGGERAVLEARRCGCEVHVFADNSKLEGLLKGPVPGAAEYPTRLARGLACAAGDAPGAEGGAERSLTVTGGLSAVT